MELRNQAPKNLNKYLCNYQTEAAIFLATKHEKTMACSDLNFSIQKIHQNSKKMVTIMRTCLVKMTLRLFQSISICCYEYGANASEAVEKISTRALLQLCQLKDTPMKKYIQQFITCFIGDTSQVSVFFLTNKNEQSLTCLQD